MPDVIDLLSSDIDSPVKAPVHLKPSSRPAPIPSRSTKVDFDFSLDDDDDDDFLWSRATKRRKLSPPVLPAVQATKAFDIAKSRPAKEVQDDIVFTSSAQRDDRDESQRSVWNVVGSQDDLSETSPMPKQRSALSSSTAALLEAIDGPKRGRKGKGKEKATEEAISDDEDPGDSADGRPASGPKKKQVAGDADKVVDKAAKAAEREKQLLEKAAAKEAAKVAKAEARELKKSEKQRAADIASVNKSKLDKNTTTPEMIVDFPMSMDGLSSLTQAREFLRKADSKTTMYTSTIPGIIKFRRSIRADFDEEAGYWRPLVKERTDQEKMVVAYLSGEEFASLVSPVGHPPDSVEDHLDRVRLLHPTHRIIYLIEGLEKLVNKEKNAQNRAYQAAVRRAAAAIPEPGQPSRRTNSNIIVDEAAIEAALLTLQIKHSVQIHHTISPLDTGETLLAMTQQLSQSRYRDPPIMSAAQMAIHPNFCMSTGQVPTGRNLEDTYLKILQQVIRVTEREANAIAKVHPNVGSLFAAFKMNGGKALQDIMKQGGGAKGMTNGVPAAERRIGPAASERLGRIFLARDESEVVG